jgi:hypothetical protein
MFTWANTTTIMILIIAALGGSADVRPLPRYRAKKEQISQPSEKGTHKPAEARKEQISQPRPERNK